MGNFNLRQVAGKVVVCRGMELNFSVLFWGNKELFFHLLGVNNNTMEISHLKEVLISYADGS